MKLKKIITSASLGAATLAVVTTSVAVSQISDSHSGDVKVQSNESQNPTTLVNNPAPVPGEILFGGGHSNLSRIYKNKVKMQDMYNSMKAALERHVWELKRHTPDVYNGYQPGVDASRHQLTAAIAESYGLKDLALFPAQYNYYYTTQQVGMHGLDYLQFKIEVESKASFKWEGPSTIPTMSAIFEIPLSNDALLTLNKNQDELEDQVEILQSLEMGVNYALTTVETKNKTDLPLTEAVLNRYGAENIFSKILDYDRFTYSYSTRINPPESFNNDQIKTTTLLITITDKESGDKINTEIEIPMTVGSYYLLNIKNKFQKDITRAIQYIHEANIIWTIPNINTSTKEVKSAPFTIEDAKRFDLSGFPFSENLDAVYTYSASVVTVDDNQYYSVTIYVSSGLKGAPVYMKNIEIGNIHIPLTEGGENTMGTVWNDLNNERHRLEEIQVTSKDVFKGTIDVNSEVGRLSPDVIERLGLNFLRINLSDPNLYYVYGKKYAMHHNLPFYDITLSIMDLHHPWIYSEVKLLVPLNEMGVSYARFTRNYHPDLVSFLQTQINMEAKRISQFVPTAYVPGSFGQVRDQPFDEDVAASLGINLPLNKTIYKYSYDLTKVNDDVDEVRINIYNSQNSNYRANTKLLIIHNKDLFNKVNPSQIEAARLALVNPFSVLKGITEPVSRKYFNQIVANQFDLGDLNLDMDEFNYTYSYFPLDADRGKLIIYVADKENPNIRSESLIDISTSEEYYKSHAEYIVEYNGVISQVTDEVDRVSNYVPSQYNRGVATTFKNAPLHQSDVKWFNLNFNGQPLILNEQRFNYFYDQKIVSDVAVEVTITVVNKINPEVQYKTKPFIMPLAISVSELSRKVRAEVVRLASLDRTGWQASAPSDRSDVPFRLEDAEWFGLNKPDLNTFDFTYTFDQYVFNNAIMYVIVHVASNVNPTIKSQFGFLMPLRSHFADI